MSWIGIVKGLKIIVEGTVEGDGIKIAKGVIRSGIGIVTSIIGKGSDEDVNDELDG